MTLQAQFGTADSFSSFDTKAGEIVISPSLTDLGVYEMTIILSDGLQEGESTMKFTVVGIQTPENNAEQQEDIDGANIEDDSVKAIIVVKEQN